MLSVSLPLTLYRTGDSIFASSSYHHYSKSSTNTPTTYKIHCHHLMTLFFQITLLPLPIVFVIHDISLPHSIVQSYAVCSVLIFIFIFFFHWKFHFIIRYHLCTLPKIVAWKNEFSHSMSKWRGKQKSDRERRRARERECERGKRKCKKLWLEHWVANAIANINEHLHTFAVALSSSLFLPALSPCHSLSFSFFLSNLAFD